MKLTLLAVSLGACGLVALLPLDRMEPRRTVIQEDARELRAAPTPRTAAPAGVKPISPGEASTKAGRRALRNLELIQKRLDILKGDVAR